MQGGWRKGPLAGFPRVPGRWRPSMLASAMYCSVRILLFFNETLGFFGLADERPAGEFLSPNARLFWGSLWLNDYLTTFPSCLLTSCGEVLLVMADLTKNLLARWAKILGGDAARHGLTRKLQILAPCRRNLTKEILEDTNIDVLLWGG